MPLVHQCSSGGSSSTTLTIVSDGFSWFLCFFCDWVCFCVEFVFGLFFYDGFCVITVCQVSWIYECLGFCMYFSMYASARMTAIFSGFGCFSVSGYSSELVHVYFGVVPLFWVWVSSLGFLSCVFGLLVLGGACVRMCARGPLSSLCNR